MENSILIFHFVFRIIPLIENLLKICTMLDQSKDPVSRDAWATRPFYLPVPVVQIGFHQLLHSSRLVVA